MGTPILAGNRAEGGYLNSRKQMGQAVMASPTGSHLNTPRPSSQKYHPRPFTPLYYPKMELGDSFYPDCMHFHVQQRLGMDINDLGQSVRAAIVTGKNSAEQGTAFGRAKNIEELAAVEGLTPEAIAHIQHMKNDPRFNKNTPQTKKIEIIKSEVGERHNISPNAITSLGKALQTAWSETKDTRKDKMNGPQSNPIGSIFLNMPNGIQFNEAADWSGSSLGNTGRFVKTMVGGGEETAFTHLMGQTVGAAGNIAGAGIAGIPALVAQLGVSGGAMAMAIGAAITGGQLQKGFESALGIAANPYMEMMFSGIGFRKFQFDFIMRPKNENEMNEVGQILKQFRTHSKPSYTMQGIGRTFMDYPMEFIIEFLTWSNGGWVPNSFLPRLKPCVCDNVTSNYTPHSIWATYDQGKPVAVNLTLSFQESELVMADDVENKGY